jgi:aspartate racemase
VKTIGIIGGMGPDATNHFCSLITKLTPAKSDQEHIPVIVFNNSAIPSRVNAILGCGESPLPELVRTARVLQSAGADFLVMPCNTAHYYFADLQAAVDIPILNIVEEAVLLLARDFNHLKTVGILGSTPTLNAGLFLNSLKTFGKNVVTPDSDVQDHFVMDAIFSNDGIKAGFLEEPKNQLLKAAEHLRRKGAEVIIAGCTEVSLVLSQQDMDMPLIDPLTVIARIAVELAMSGHSDHTNSAEVEFAGSVAI